MTDWECIHCGGADPDPNHWRTCSEHPALVEIDNLRALLREVAVFEEAGTCNMCGHTCRPDARDDTVCARPECELAKALGANA